MVSLHDRSALRPVAELLAAEAAKPGQPAPDPPGPTTSDTDPRQVMPAAMLRWVTGRSQRRIDVSGLDKSTIYQLYRGWDTHLERLPPDRLVELAVDGEPPPVPGLPAFSTVVGRLHDACYRSELVMEWLLRSIDVASEVSPPEVARAALWLRTEHARRWLAVRGGELCWIYRRVPPGGPVIPARREVHAAIAALRSGRRERSEEQAIRAALFGTDGGPPLTVLLAAHPAEEMIAALELFLSTQARPLREQALARLHAPLAAPSEDRDGQRR